MLFTLLSPCTMCTGLATPVTATPCSHTQLQQHRWSTAALRCSAVAIHHTCVRVDSRRIITFAPRLHLDCTSLELFKQKVQHIKLRWASDCFLAAHRILVEPFYLHCTLGTWQAQSTIIRQRRTVLYWKKKITDLFALLLLWFQCSFHEKTNKTEAWTMIMLS